MSYSPGQGRFSNEWLEHAAKTDIGLRRANNQDAHAEDLAGSQESFATRGHLFIVADGMGAHAAGETASKKAVEIIPLTYRKLKDIPPAEALREAVLEANRQIYECAQANENFHGMGTTVSALVILPSAALVAQVGDSRVYRCRQQRIEQLSQDHSLVWELRNLPDEIRPQYIPRNIITRSLGPQISVEVDLEGPFPIQAGDRFVLCSDGLSGQVSDEEIGQIVNCLPPQEAVQTLIDLATLRGGPDNITVTVVQIKSGEPFVSYASAEAGENTGNSSTRGKSTAWILPGVFLLAAVVSGYLLWPPGPRWLWLIPLALLAAAVVCRPRVLRGLKGISRSLVTRPLGKGPYSSADCSPRRETVETLLKLLGEVEAAARQSGWSVDWDRLEQLKETALASAENQPEQGLVTVCQAISYVMSIARAQRESRPTQSGDYYRAF